MHMMADTKATVAFTGDQWVIVFQDDSKVLYCKDPADIGGAIVSHFAERRLTTKPFVDDEATFQTPQQLEINFPDTRNLK